MFDRPTSERPLCELTGDPPQQIMMGISTPRGFVEVGTGTFSPKSRDFCATGCNGAPMVREHVLLSVPIGSLGSVVLRKEVKTCPRRTLGVEKTKLPRLGFKSNIQEFDL